jgi:hypothetical protein
MDRPQNFPSTPLHAQHKLQRACILAPLMLSLYAMSGIIDIVKVGRDPKEDAHYILQGRSLFILGHVIDDMAVALCGVGGECRRDCSR